MTRQHLPILLIATKKSSLNVIILYEKSILRAFFQKLRFFIKPANSKYLHYNSHLAFTQFGLLCHILQATLFEDMFDLIKASSLA